MSVCVWCCPLLASLKGHRCPLRDEHWVLTQSVRALHLWDRLIYRWERGGRTVGVRTDVRRKEMEEEITGGERTRVK